MGAPGADSAEISRRERVNQTAPERTAHAAPGLTHITYGLGFYGNPSMVYTSPVIHRVTLRPCKGGETYTYRVAGDGRKHAFTMPPDAGSSRYPVRFGLTADLGQTAASEANVALLERLLSAADADAAGVLLAGDLAYADGWYSRWDSFGRMMERLSTKFAVMTTGGNHEIASGEAWLSYNARYPMPHEASHSSTNLWWSRDVGPAHVIALCSYAATEPGSLQHRWLLRDLAAVDRLRTPWLIVMTHVPFFHSNSKHRLEAEAMRRHMEPALYTAGVDVIIAGHVHAYERTEAMLDGQLNECGPVHLTLGDGGNREGAALPWVHPMPEWSAFREASFGVGSLVLHNATHALFNWSRTACENATAPEHVSLSPTCASAALGPFSFGPDGHRRARTTADPAWIVRSRGRTASEPGCPEPAGGWIDLPAATAHGSAGEARGVLTAASEAASRTRQRHVQAKAAAGLRADSATSAQGQMPPVSLPWQLIGTAAPTVSLVLLLLPLLLIPLVIQIRIGSAQVHADVEGATERRYAALL